MSKKIVFIDMDYTRIEERVLVLVGVVPNSKVRHQGTLTGRIPSKLTMKNLKGLK